MSIRLVDLEFFFEIQDHRFSRANTKAFWRYFGIKVGDCCAKMLRNKGDVREMARIVRFIETYPVAIDKAITLKRPGREAVQAELHMCRALDSQQKYCLLVRVRIHRQLKDFLGPMFVRIHLAASAVGLLIELVRSFHLSTPRSIGFDPRTTNHTSCYP